MDEVRAEARGGNAFSLRTPSASPSLLNASTTPREDRVVEAVDVGVAAAEEEADPAEGRRCRMTVSSFWTSSKRKTSM